MDSNSVVWSDASRISRVTAARNFTLPVMATVATALFLTAFSNCFGYQDSSENRDATPLSAGDPVSKGVRDSRDAIFAGLVATLPPILSEAAGTPLASRRFTSGLNPNFLSTKSTRSLRE